MTILLISVGQAAFIVLTVSVDDLILPLIHVQRDIELIQTGHLLPQLFLLGEGLFHLSLGILQLRPHVFQLRFGIVHAKTIKARIRQILDETNSKKINIIAHSKGGLEARMAASSLGMGEYIASITTIGTPHRGSKTIDKLLKAPDSLFNIASFAVDNWIGLIGDTKPNFYAVCKDFSTEYAETFNKENPDVPGIFYQSFAGMMRTPLSDINLSTANAVIKMIEGENDGLVSVESAKWGESFTLLRGRTNRGVSHYDEIDFRRSPLSSKKSGDGIADICDVYKAIVKDLADRGF